MAQKIRQSWSKINLYNLSRLSTPAAATKTFFQQKWLAKSMTRGYHHPQIKEKHWTRMFDRRLPAVVPMDYQYLAQTDGSEMALGRGGGLDKEADQVHARDSRRRLKTPYMHMTFHPLERRLDTAIWRALFASSTRQARQFVVHGGVKVNGKRMLHPGYRLNPGDMFQVDPDKVMYATGARKAKKTGAMSTQDLADLREQRRREEAAKAQETEAGADTAGLEEDLEAMAAKPEEQEDPKAALKLLSMRASRILDSKRDLSGKRRQELREFSRTVRKTLSKLRGIEEEQVEETIDGLELGLAEILSKVPQDSLPKGEAAALDSARAAAEQDQATEEQAVDDTRTRRDAELLHAALERARENPIDASKPYATPWKPREFMSAFAFIPRYLEVNQNICSAVYLRHPVARPGLAEVPTPFHGETMGLTFNWYLKRR